MELGSAVAGLRSGHAPSAWHALARFLSDAAEDAGARACSASAGKLLGAQRGGRHGCQGAQGSSGSLGAGGAEQASVAEGIPALGAHLPPGGPAWHGWELCLGGCGINYATLQTSGMTGDQLVGGVRAEEGQMRSEQTCGCHKIADPLARKKCF